MPLKEAESLHEDTVHIYIYMCIYIHVNAYECFGLFWVFLRQPLLQRQNLRSRKAQCISEQPDSALFPTLSLIQK